MRVRKRKLFNWPKRERWRFLCYSETDSLLLCGFQPIKEKLFISPFLSFCKRKTKKLFSLTVNTKNRNSISENFPSHCRWLKAHFAQQLCECEKGQKRKRKEEEIDEENVRVFRKRDDKVFQLFLSFFDSFQLSNLFKASHALPVLFITQRQVILFYFFIFAQIKWMQLN